MISKQQAIESFRPELLSPVGTWENLRAAVENGADGVYLGTKEFNARINARNFTLEELGKVAAYCHSAGVRVYLTLNTLVKNSELKHYFQVLTQAYMQGIDGVILQHISFVELIKKHFPGLAVFISTQGAIGNAAGASLLKTADRVILPRELSLTEIERIIKAGVNVEVFVHGALCFSYSGLCLFSSFVDNRSGNRGCCAQLCRQRFNGSYPLSTRELCLVRRIPDLIRAGVRGFKIEGRMRSPVYVAVATRLYRKAIDSFYAGKFEVPQKEAEDIEVVFNREFTEGFLVGEKEVLSPEKPMNRGAYLGAAAGGVVRLQRRVAVGDGVGIWEGGGIRGAFIKEMSRDGQSISSAEAGEAVDLRLNIADNAKVFVTSSPRISLTPDFTIERKPVTSPIRRKPAFTLPQSPPKTSRQTVFLVKAYSLKEAEGAAQGGADIVFYNIFMPDFPASNGWREKAELGAFLPRILSDDELERAILLVEQKKPGAVLTGNLGFLKQRGRFDIPVYADYTFNTFNDLDTAFLQRYNVTPMLSPELSLDEMAKVMNKDVVIFCHGDIVLVNTMIEITANRLKDDKGLSFPVRKEHTYWQILNGKRFGLFNDIRKLYGAGYRQFFIDQQGKAAMVVPLYRRMLTEEVPDRRLRKGYTSGHLYRPVQ